MEAAGALRAGPTWVVILAAGGTARVRAGVHPGGGGQQRGCWRLSVKVRVGVRGPESGRSELLRQGSGRGGEGQWLCREGRRVGTVSIPTWLVQQDLGQHLGGSSAPELQEERVILASQGPNTPKPRKVWWDAGQIWGQESDGDTFPPCAPASVGTGQQAHPSPLRRRQHWAGELVALSRAGHGPRACSWVKLGLGLGTGSSRTAGQGGKDWDKELGAKLVPPSLRGKTNSQPGSGSPPRNAHSVVPTLTASMQRGSELPVSPRAPGHPEAQEGEWASVMHWDSECAGATWCCMAQRWRRCAGQSASTTSTATWRVLWAPCR